jgi:nickel/cobalt exporter
MRRAVRAATVLALAGGALLAGPAPQATAHPLGNFTVNTAVRLVVSPGEIRVHYALDMAELPTFQELSEIDTDGDGSASGPERDAWAARTATELVPTLHLEVGDRQVKLVPRASTAALRRGQAGLQVLRLDALFVAPVPDEGRILFRDVSFPERIGWHEVTATGSGGAAVSGSSVPLASPSDGLRGYPEGLLSSPLEIREARFSFSPGAQVVPAGDAAGSGRPGLEGGRLAALIGAAELSPAVVLLGLLAALAFGALHALAPGHGKTITAAYLIGAGTRVRHALGAGLAVSAMHTASVVLVGLLVLFAERLFPPERVYPWLGALAGAVAVLLGGSLLMTRLRGGSPAHRAQDHDHGPIHRHGGRRSPQRGHRPLSRKGLAALAVSGGLLPSPTAVLVLVAAVAFQRVAFGVALLVAFGLGLAAALSAVGLLATRARDVLSDRFGGRLAAALPALSAAAIMVMGVAVTAQAVASF